MPRRRRDPEYTHDDIYALPIGTRLEHPCNPRPRGVSWWFELLEDGDWWEVTDDPNRRWRMEPGEAWAWFNLDQSRDANGVMRNWTVVPGVPPIIKRLDDYENLLEVRGTV